MFTKRVLFMLTSLVVLASLVAPALAQSIGSQGPATTGSQSYSFSHDPASSLLVLALWAVFAGLCIAIVGYESHPHRG